MCEECKVVIYHLGDAYAHREELINGARIAGKLRGNHHIKYLCRRCAQDLYNSWQNVNIDQTTMFPEEDVG